MNILLQSRIDLFERTGGDTYQILKTKESEPFLQNNHLQGNCRSFLKLGLIHNNQIVSILTIRNSKPQIAEISRFCNKMNTSVVGGFARLLKKAEEILRQSGYKNLITYSDRRYSNGSLYENNGFEFIGKTDIDFFWTKGNKRYARQISWSIPLEESDQTRDELMLDKGYHKIYGAGNLRWEKNL